MKVFTEEECMARLKISLEEDCLAPNCPNCCGIQLVTTIGKNVKIGFVHGKWDLSSFKLACQECGWEAVGEEAWNVSMDM